MKNEDFFKKLPEEAKEAWLKMQCEIENRKQETKEIVTSYQQHLDEMKKDGKEMEEQRNRLSKKAEELKQQNNALKTAFKI